jgi:hypothetical protein
LRCNVSASVYLLSKEGMPWCKAFSNLEEALEYASQMVSDETDMFIFNESGAVIFQTIVAPAVLA